MRLALGVTMVAAAQFLLLVPWPAAPDVLPSRPSGDRREKKARVAHDLTNRGVSAPDRASQVAAMSARDVDYFSADSRRVQFAAGIPVEDIVAGIALLAAAGAIAVVGAYQATREK